MRRREPAVAPLEAISSWRPGDLTLKARVVRRY